MHAKRSRALILLLLCLFAGAANSATAQPLAGIFPKGDKPGGPLFFAFTVGALFLALAVHELGHLLTGIAQGFRFELFVVGPLGVRRSGRGIRLYLNKNVGYMGGVAATVPVDPAAPNRKKFAWILAAGPAASLLGALGAFLLFGAAHSGAARGFWLIAGVASVAVFLATTLPARSGPFFTDRARFQRLVSTGKAGAMEEALLSIMACNARDNSCKDIPLEKALLLQGDDDKGMRFWGHYYAWQYFRENGRVSETEEAYRALYAAKDAVAPALWRALGIEEAERG